MARATRTYDHFCTLARALERVGDRWTLLVVRDLLRGPRRFTDLMDRLGGITPKTLTQRLRDLTESGIVEVDRAKGRREVWYRLTPAGAELAPAVESLMLWGLRHARRPSLPGESIHPEHVLEALRLVLEQAPPPSQPLRWRFSFAGESDYSLSFDGRDWMLGGPNADSEPNVVVHTTSQAWLKFLGNPPAERLAPQQGIELQGTARDIRRFTDLLAWFPDGVRSQTSGR